MDRILSSLKHIRASFFSPKIPLEKRITYAMVVIALLGELFGFIESLLLKLPLVSIILPLISIILLLAISIWGLHTKKIRLFSFLSISIMTMIIFPLMFFANAGLHGGMPYYFLVAVVCTALALKGKPRIILFAATITEYIILFFLYRFFPEGFLPMSHEEAFIDQLSSLLITSMILFTFSYAVSAQNYHDRKRIQCG